MPRKWYSLVDPLSQEHIQWQPSLVRCTSSLGIPIWSILVACLPAILKRPQYPLTPFYLVSHPDFCAQMDASGTCGCTVVLGSQWLQWQWPLEWYEIGIMAKELIPIMFTCIVWEPHLSKHRINFQCDNVNLVIAINKGSSKDKFVKYLLCSLSCFVADFDIYITASHLPGVINITADHLSCGNMCQAFEVTPSLMQHPAIIPSSAFRLISPHTLDWISLVFCKFSK